MTPKERLQRDMGELKDLPKTAMENIRNDMELARQNIENIPQSVIQDMKELPHLQAKAIIEGPSKAREELREHISGKRELMALNILDIAVDIIDTILPG